MAQALTQKVMGDANYLVNPCVIMCPFAGPKCQHGCFRMNGNCKPSQLCTRSCDLHSRDMRPRRAVRMPAPAAAHVGCPRRLALAERA